MSPEPTYKPIDLKKAYGRRYRVTVEESYAAEKYEGKSNDIAWYYEIEGRCGKLYPYGDGTLAVFMTPRQAAKFRRLYHAMVIPQECDEGTAFVIGPELVKEALKLIRPRLRRVLTPEQRLKLIERVRGNRFAPGPQRTSGPKFSTIS